MTEQEIIALFEKRSEDAIAETGKQYGRYCRSIVGHILWQKEDVEECLNDIWLALWNAIPPAKPESLQAYLAKTARNMALNAYKKNHAKKRETDRVAISYEELSECVSDRTDVEESYEAKEVAEKINLFLKQCSNKQRELFLWRYFYLDSIGEIAARTGKKESAVRTELFRMRKQLAQFLKD